MDLLTKDKLTDDSFKGATPEDVAKAVHGLSHMVREDKELVSKNNKTYEEAFASFEKRLADVGAMIEKVRQSYPPDPLAMPQHVGEYAARKGGLFKKGAPTLKPIEVLELAPRDKTLRGEDAELVNDIHTYWDACTFKYQLEALKHWNNPSAYAIGLEKVKRAPEYERLGNLMEFAGYQKTLIHPETGGIANPLTFTIVSATVVDLIRIALRVANQFVQIPLTHVNQKIPANRGDAIGVKGGAATTDPPPTANITNLIPHIELMGAVAFGTVDFDCKDVLAFLWWSDRAVVESAIPLVDYLRNMIVFAHSRAIDRACMSGDRTGTNHMDDFTPNFSIRDARRLWNGLRRIGTNFMIDNAAAAFDATDFRDMRAAMGKYGLAPEQNVCWMNTGPLYDIMSDTSVLTIEKFGPQATIKTGTLALFEGIALIPTEWIPTDQGTGGFSTAVGTATSVVMANVTRFMLGQYQTVTTEVTRWGPMQTTIIQAQGYYDFRPVEATDGTTDVFTTTSLGAGNPAPISIKRNCLN